MAMAKPLNPSAKEYQPKQQHVLLLPNYPNFPCYSPQKPFLMQNQTFGPKKQDFYHHFQTPIAPATFFFPPPSPSFENEEDYPESFGQDQSLILKEGEKALKEVLKISSNNNGDEKKTSFTSNLPPRLLGNKTRSRSVVWESWRRRGKSVNNPDCGASDHFSSSTNYTTVMIRNIPNQYRRKDFLWFVDGLCRDHHLEYDFFYLPMDFRTHDNLGFAFVNFTTSDDALTFKKVLEGYEWRVFKTSRGQFLSNKICQLAWGRIQGKDALVEHFEKSCFVCENKNYLPVVFTPARNGFNSCSSKMTNVGRMRRELGLLSGR